MNLLILFLLKKDSRTARAGFQLWVKNFALVSLLEMSVLINLDKSPYRHELLTCLLFWWVC